MNNQELLVSRNDISKFELSTSHIKPLQPGEILLQINKFGLTTNNVTYAVLGEEYHYFDFFPTKKKGMAKVNVWGISTIIKSNVTELPVGEKIFGYFPMSQYVLMKPFKITKSFFYEKRDKLPLDMIVYNQYVRISHDPYYDPRHVDYMLVFRPLWWTSFCLDDFLNEKRFFDAENVIISSASSKTAFGFALMLRRNNRRKKIIGITSGKNMDFVKSLNLYHVVVNYDHVSELEQKPSVYVDVAGDDNLGDTLQSTLGSNLKIRLLAGISHQTTEQRSTKGSEVFFAAPWIDHRRREIGREFVRRNVVSWRALMDNVHEWVDITKGYGSKSVIKAYKSLIDGESSPNQGFVLSMHEKDAEDMLSKL
ncbi:cytochrome b [Acrasis kona]|uniref:Cytochrome b n=1 Tax=Acrasis kona TaxID=1008807 RepID=A0AAW2ZMS8_9EUKA